PRYSMPSDSAFALITQARATSTPAHTPTNLGPNLSTRQPSTGHSHVSTNTKTENAIWIAGTLQPCASWIGLTKRVDTDCRLSIIDMQITRSVSGHERPTRTATRSSALSCVVCAAPCVTESV